MIVTLGGGWNKRLKAKKKALIGGKQLVLVLFEEAFGW